MSLRTRGHVVGTPESVSQRVRNRLLIVGDVLIGALAKVDGGNCVFPLGSLSIPGRALTKKPTVGAHFRYLLSPLLRLGHVGAGGRRS